MTTSQPSQNAFQALGALGSQGAAQNLLGSLVQPEQYVGEVYHSAFHESLVLLHDYHRQRAGGIPALSFLLATRITPGQPFNHEEEDASIVLLRVIDSGSLPNAQEAERVRVETAQRATQTPDKHWDDQEHLDSHTAQALAYAALRCRVIGTFHLVPTAPGSSQPLMLKFGSDISNFYPNKGLKVYKPVGDALVRIVNYVDPEREVHGARVSVGRVRYASTNRAFQQVDDVRVEITPEDLFAQKSALFGMSRAGKSNTTKIIIKSVFDLRYEAEQPLRVGQLVFDPNGEYANENTQDASGVNAQAIKNIWRQHGTAAQADVVTYGITSHPNDPGRKMMLLNFHLDPNLQVGKDIINATLEGDSTRFVEGFKQVDFEPPPAGASPGDVTRFNRRVLAYRALLVKAGYAAPASIAPSLRSLFGQPLLLAMTTSTGANAAAYQAAAVTLGRQTTTWPALASALEGLADFVTTKDSGYGAFNTAYVQSSSTGEPWADEKLIGILRMLMQPSGAKLVARALDQHSPSTTRDYVDDIYDDLLAGRLVIIDQSSGDPELNRSSAYRVVTTVFKRHQQVFRAGRAPQDVLIYAEEAHNLLPAGDSRSKLGDFWVRTAKEGSKYRLGLIYATQEVSSIHESILKNTANWFIAHLNNTDETRELNKYYDFKDFEQSILRAQDRGFVRVKTMSNLFVVPVQIDKFEV